ncbi:MAG: UvrD-helicase domain-containing protein [Myxococcota bacterium]|nr:UvrD-helicase domain-containing protein [Myxococcota bacterium]
MKTKSMVNFDHLNDQQRAAVFKTDGPVLVLAGAGSGKTRVITYRIAYLVSQGVSPSEILALSFTNKAAKEMRERVIELIGSAAKTAHLSTFHALGLRFLRDEYKEAGLSEKFTILDEGDQLAAIIDLMREVGYDTDEFDPKLVHGLISHYKSRLERPDARRGGLEGAVAHIAPLYGRRLRALNAVDFDDLIALPVWLLETNEEIGYRWSGRFKYMMVDEYQDTNLAQLRLLKALAKRYQNVCAVGDDDQSIYGWRGAEAGNILRFDKHFKGAQTIALTQNYRSTNRILRAANKLILNNAERHKKSLWSELGEGESLRYMEAKDGDEEAKWVATDILSSKRHYQADWNEFSILYRTNAQARLLEDAIRNQDIPYKIIGGTRFYDRKEVRDLVAYLRFINNPWDEVALRRIINFPSRGIGDLTIQRIAEESRKRDVPFFRLVERPSDVPNLKNSTRDLLAGFHLLMKDFRDRFRQPDADFGSICRDLIETIDFRNAFGRTEKNVRRLMIRLDNLDEVASALGSFRKNNPECGLEDFLSMLSLDRNKEEEEEENENVVALMTLHSSKGLEFNHVYLVGFEEGFVPHIRQADASSAATAPVDITEERRLIYVGLTRARKRLTLTGSKTRLKYGRILNRKPSRFLHEIPKELFDGDRSGKMPELTGDALEKRAQNAFDEMFKIVGGDEIV